MATIEALQHALDSALSLVGASGLTETARVALLEATTRLTLVLQKPEDALIKLAYAPTQLTSIRVFMELGLFKEIVDKAPVTSAQLAAKSGADQTLLERFARVMVAAGLLEETNETTYAPNGLTKSLATREVEGTMIAHYDIGLKGQILVPEFLKERNGYKNPDNQLNTPLHLGLGIPDGQSFFEFLAGQPRLAGIMHSMFEADRGSRPCWVNWFPVKEKLLDAHPLKTDVPLLVDVAGGRGHDLIEFTKKFGDAYPESTYVLHDLPHVCADTTVPLDLTKVEKKPFNFFEEKVVPGARLYYMKFILHDWNDEKSLTILKNITSQMNQGYSNLIIEDFILPDKGCPLLPAEWDVIMMSYLASMERTKSQWTKLLEAAGLEIEGFYPPPGDGTGIIVTRLKG